MFYSCDRQGKKLSKHCPWHCRVLTLLCQHSKRVLFSYPLDNIFLNFMHSKTRFAFWNLIFSEKCLSGSLAWNLKPFMYPPSLCVWGKELCFMFLSYFGFTTEFVEIIDILVFLRRLHVILVNANLSKFKVYWRIPTTISYYIWKLRIDSVNVDESYSRLTQST